MQDICAHVHQTVYVIRPTSCNSFTYYNMNAYTPCMLLTFISVTCKYISLSVVLMDISIKFKGSIT